MSDKIFIDTNILVYAHDLDAGEKHLRARDAISRLWRAENPPAVSIQVLQELFVTLTKRGVARTDAHETIRDYSVWCKVDNTWSLLDQAVGEMKRWQLSLWDSLILAAARSAGVDMLWTEDFSHGQDYHGIVAINPLADYGI